VALQKIQFRATLTNWYRRHGRALPWRQTRDPYAILVSEFMLQQTQVATVIPYYNEWLRRFPDFAALARASENDVLHAWQGLGYYARARNLHSAAKRVHDRHGDKFPRSPAAIRALPGVGRYTANAIATFAFDQPVPIVEANTGRVLTRLFDLRSAIDRAAGREALWKRAALLVPKRVARIYNSALIDLGALVCLPRAPRCTICPVKKFCLAKTPETLPLKQARPPTIRLIENHAFIIRAERILLQKADDRWRGMWILPPVQVNSPDRRPIYNSIFPFTNHRIALNVYTHRTRKIDRRSQRWIRIDSLDSIPIPSPHRRTLRNLLSKGVD
jgi:A/G-specific adenine glycosylase